MTMVRFIVLEFRVMQRNGERMVDDFETRDGERHLIQRRQRSEIGGGHRASSSDDVFTAALAGRSE